MRSWKLGWAVAITALPIVALLVRQTSAEAVAPPKAVHATGRATQVPTTQRKAKGSSTPFPATGQCPYCETIADDYPTTAAWASATIAQLRSWGFNSLGPYSDYGLLGSQMPFTVQLAMASGDDWFAPSFVTNAEEVAATQVAPLANNPNVIGYFTDSELNWGPPEDDGSTLTALQEYEALPEGSPGWTEAQQYIGNPNGFVTALATRYFSVTTAAVRQYDPNHLILGVKAEGQEIQSQLLAAAAPYVNVFSINDYTLQPGLAQVIDKIWPQYLPVEPNLADFYKYAKRPIMIGGYTALGPDTALTPNQQPGVYATSPTQQGRATAWADFIAPLYEDNPWMVGDEWFENVDEPAGGRVGDGEDNNFGLVNVYNQPYTDLVDEMTLMHSIAPDRLATTGPSCDSWADGSNGVTCTAYMPEFSYPVSIIDGTMPAGTQGSKYDQAVHAGGGDGSYTFSITQGSLPGNLKINSKTGLVARTPKTAGTFSFTVQVEDSQGSVALQPLSILVTPKDPVAIKTSKLAKAELGDPYSATLATTGGTAPDTWSITTGALPSGLSLGGGGVLSGVPSASGTFTFTVEATDSSTPAGSATRTYTLVVSP